MTACQKRKVVGHNPAPTAKRRALDGLEGLVREWHDEKYPTHQTSNPTLLRTLACGNSVTAAQWKQLLQTAPAAEVCQAFQAHSRHVPKTLDDAEWKELQVRARDLAVSHHAMAHLVTSEREARWRAAVQTYPGWRNPRLWWYLTQASSEFLKIARFCDTGFLERLSWMAPLEKLLPFVADHGWAVAGSAAVWLAEYFFRVYVPGQDAPTPPEEFLSWTPNDVDVFVKLSRETNLAQELRWYASILNPDTITRASASVVTFSFRADWPNVQLIFGCRSIETTVSAFDSSLLHVALVPQGPGPSVSPKWKLWIAPFSAFQILTRQAFRWKPSRACDARVRKYRARGYRIEIPEALPKYDQNDQSHFNVWSRSLAEEMKCMDVLHPSAGNPFHETYEGCGCEPMVWSLFPEVGNVTFLLRMTETPRKIPLQYGRKGIWIMPVERNQALMSFLGRYVSLFRYFKSKQDLNPRFTWVLCRDAPRFRQAADVGAWYEVVLSLCTFTRRSYEISFRTCKRPRTVLATDMHLCRFAQN